MCLAERIACRRVCHRNISPKGIPEAGDMTVDGLASLLFLEINPVFSVIGSMSR
jgi:hypothetical protein